MKDIYKNMNSQDILRNLGISVDIQLDSSETYDYEIAGFDNDYDPKLLDFTNSIVFDTPILNNLTNDDPTIENIKLCEFDNRINDVNYIYSGLTVSYDYDEFTNHFNILDSEGNIIHDYENFILNNDLFTYTGITNEIHYFVICEYSDTPVPTSSPTPEPTNSSTPNPTNTETPTPTETSTPLPSATSTETPSPTSTIQPTPNPTLEPTPNPTVEPTPNPTLEPTPNPTLEPTPVPTSTEGPTSTPNPTSTLQPTPNPTSTEAPTPTPNPTSTNQPTPNPTNTAVPTATPVPTSTIQPTPVPTSTEEPTATPAPTSTLQPTALPTSTNQPTPNPTVEPTPQPTLGPTPNPTVEPTPNPTSTEIPTPIPTSTQAPTPTPNPTSTNQPTPNPTSTIPPTLTPNPTSTNQPTPNPTSTIPPTLTPNPTSTNQPTPEPTSTNQPTSTPDATPNPTPVPTSTNQPTPNPTVEPTPVPTSTEIPTPIPTSTPVPTAIPLSCLTPITSVQAVGGQYQFNGSYGIYGINLGTYEIQGVPSSHPIAFLNNGKESIVSYSGQNNAGTKVGSDGNTYTYYYGDVTLTINGDFGVISYDCYYHGYMGGQNNLNYSVSCTSPQPTTTPNPTPQPTSTPEPTPTNTPEPTSTETPTPTSTVGPLQNILIMKEMDSNSGTMYNILTGNFSGAQQFLCNNTITSGSGQYRQTSGDPSNPQNGDILYHNGSLAINSQFGFFWNVDNNVSYKDTWRWITTDSNGVMTVSQFNCPTSTPVPNPTATVTPNPTPTSTPDPTPQPTSTPLMSQAWIPTPDAWFDASDTSSYTLSGSNLTSVTDKAGNFNMLVDGTPTRVSNGLNNKNVWDFNGNESLISSNSGPYASGGNHWAIGVFQFHTTTSTRDSFWSADGGKTYALSSGNSSNNWYGEIDYDGSNSIVNGVAKNVFTQRVNQSQWAIVAVIANKTDNEFYGRLNGGIKTNVDVYNNSMDTNCSDLRMMRNRSGVKLDGRMAEYFHYSSYVGGDTNNYNEVWKAEGYLAHKWGLQGLLPSNHPYRHNAPTL